MYKLRSFLNNSFGISGAIAVGWTFGSLFFFCIFSKDCLKPLLIRVLMVSHAYATVFDVKLIVFFHIYILLTPVLNSHGCVFYYIMNRHRTTTEMRWDYLWDKRPLHPFINQLSWYLDSSLFKLLPIYSMRFYNFRAFFMFEIHN